MRRSNRRSKSSAANGGRYSRASPHSTVRDLNGGTSSNESYDAPAPNTTTSIRSAYRGARHQTSTARSAYWRVQEEPSKSPPGPELPVGLPSVRAGSNIAQDTQSERGDTRGRP